MSYETVTSLLPELQSNTQNNQETNIKFAEEVSILTEDFYNFWILAAEETLKISARVAAANQMKIW